MSTKSLLWSWMVTGRITRETRSTADRVPLTVTSDTSALMSMMRRESFAGCWFSTVSAKLRLICSSISTDTVSGETRTSRMR